MSEATKTLEDELLADFNRAETIFLSCVDENRGPTYAERVFLKRLDIVTDGHVDRELERVQRVPRFQQVSGVYFERDKQAAELQAASDLSGRELPKLQAKRDKIDAEMRSIEATEATARQRLEQMINAVETLKTLCPPFVRRQVEMDVFSVGKHLGATRGELRVRRDELQLLLERDPENAELLAELPICLAELARVEAEFDTAVTECERPLSYYVI